VLEKKSIVDTPGTRAVIESHEQTTQEFLINKHNAATRQQGDKSDAIIYVLMPVTRETDTERLNMFEQSSRIPDAAPYNSIAVVHKWETINSNDPYTEAKLKVNRIRENLKKGEGRVTSGVEP
jgi:uncharacterized protein with ATP-grasp and redox domains